MDQELQKKLNELNDLNKGMKDKIIKNLENIDLGKLFWIFVRFYGVVCELYKRCIVQNEKELQGERSHIKTAEDNIELVVEEIIKRVNAKHSDKRTNGKLFVAGNMNGTPGIFFTSNPKKGVYITYLLNKDNKELFLTLNQGVDGKSHAQLEAAAEEIREKIGYQPGLWPGNDQIDTGNREYDAGCIYFKKYTLDMPNDTELMKDLKQFKDLYDCCVVNQISSFIKAKGFKYADEQVKNFYLSFKTKPFVLLAGMSGTGKTRLVRLFAEAIGAFKPNDPKSEQRYLQVPVKPDWTDSTDLFGHLDLNNNFVPGAIIDFIERASKEENRCKPYILCMDEMNLARVEYYLSDFLSVIETRDWDKDGKKIITDPLVPKACYSGAEEKTIEDRYKALQLPDNLYLVGTVNMDETTFPFSKKVLDRANTIEFSAVDLELHSFEGQEGQDQDPEGYIIEADNDFLRAEYLVLQRDCQEGWNEVCEYNNKIKEINEILGDENFGYRIRDEIIFYMLYNNRFKLMDDDKAFDYQIMQKILPRIQGESRTVETILKDLHDYCLEKYSLSLSAAKIEKMLRRYEEDGFTTFWS